MKTHPRFIPALIAAAGLPLMTSLHGCRTFSSHPETTSMLVNGVPLRIDHLEHNIYNNQYKYAGKMDTVKYVTIHNTWNCAPAKNERDYLNRRRDRKYISFQYAVDESEAIEIMPPGERAWHAGDKNGEGNSCSIGVEICRSRCTGEQEPLCRRAEANAVRLAAWLLFHNHLPIKALKKHQDWSGKHCPHRILDEGRWEEFKNAVAESLKALEMKEIKKKSPHTGAAPETTPAQ